MCVHMKENHEESLLGHGGRARRLDTDVPNPLQLELLWVLFVPGG